MNYLKSTDSDWKMRPAIKRAFREWWGASPLPMEPQVDFEHGCWWVTDLVSGAQWAVVDAHGGHSVDGFDFEQVTEGRADD